MHSERLNHPKKILLTFLMFYFLLWSLLPSLILHSVYPDSAENLALSHALSWSYSKHPPLGMSLLHLLNLVFHNNEFTTFVASGLCLTLSLYSLYHISSRYLHPRSAVAATLLSGLSYYFIANFVLQFNQNTIMLPFWVASIACLLSAMKSNRLIDWVLLSVICFLGVMAKYETLLIIGVELLYLGMHFNKTLIKGFVLSLLLFMLLLTPHLVWLCHHDFYPIQFLLHSTGHANKSHLALFFGALIAQPFNLVLALLVLYFLTLTKKINKNDTPLLNTTLAHPLPFFALMPWAIFCVLSLFINVKAEWGYPLLILWIPAIFYFFSLQCQQLKPIIITVSCLHVFVFSGYILSQYTGQKTHRSNWPSSQLAHIATDFWQRNGLTSTPPYVGGDEYLSFYLTAYLPTQTLFLKDLSFEKSAWINQYDFNKRGGLIIESDCHHSIEKYKKLGFNAIKSQCFSAQQTNKFKPNNIPFTLYLIAPQQMELTEP